MNSIDWTFEGSPIVSVDLDKYYGFVYLITNTINGKMYIGKKILSFKKKLPPLKGKKRKRIKYVESDWKTYWGSSDYLKDEIEEFGIHNFKREILSFQTSKSANTYEEVRQQFERDVLYSFNDNLDKMYYNSNISGKFYFRLEILLEMNEQIRKTSNDRNIIKHLKLLEEKYTND